MAKTEETKSADKILQAARLSASRSMPYFRRVLFSLRPVAKIGIGTMGVDAGWRLYFDPATVEKWGVKQVAGVLLHECGHCIGRHNERRGDKPPGDWNVACDAAINDDLIEAGVTLPDGPVTPETLKLPAKKTEDFYFENMKRQKSTGGNCDAGDAGDDEDEADGGGGGGEGIGEQGKGACSGKCGGVAGNPHDWEPKAGKAARDDKTGVEVKPVQVSTQDVIRRHTAQDISKAAKAAGNVPAGLAGWAERELAPPKISWQRKLARITRCSIQTVAGALDYSRQRPARRQGAFNAALGQRRAPLMQSLVGRRPNVAVVLDVSGSMLNDRDMPSAMAECIGIAKACGGSVMVHATDAAVEAAGKVSSLGDLQRLDREGGGGGGTDMAVGVRAAVAQKPAADVVIVLTDGYTPWPERSDLNGAHLIAVITPGGESAPEWCDCIEIERDAA